MKRKAMSVLAMAVLAVGIPIGAYTVPVIEVGPNVSANLLNQVTNWLSLLEQIVLVYQDYQQLLAAYKELESLADPEDRIIGHIVHGISEELRYSEGFGYSRDDIAQLWELSFPGFDVPDDFDPVAQAEATNRRMLETIEVVMSGLKWANKNNIQGHLDLERFKERLLRSQGNLSATQAAAMLDSWGGQEASRSALYLQMMANLQAMDLAERTHREAVLAKSLAAWTGAIPTRPHYSDYPLQPAAPF